MKELWRRTTELFRESPILWLPLFCADLSAFCLISLREIATKQIRIWIMTGQSALGEITVLPITPANSIKVAAGTFPLIWANYILNACLYTTAFVVTASFVWTAVQENAPKMMGALENLRGYSRRILVFSLKLLGVSLLTGLAVFGPLVFLCIVVLKRYNFDPAIRTLAVLPFEVCVAWILAPSGIRLLQPSQSHGLAEKTKRNGRSFAILAAVASSVISGIALHYRQAIIIDLLLTQEAQLNLLDATISLLIAIPFAPLWVVLSLLAADNVQNQELQDTSVLDQSAG